MTPPMPRHHMDLLSVSTLLFVIGLLSAQVVVGLNLPSLILAVTLMILGHKVHEKPQRHGWWGFVYGPVMLALITLLTFKEVPHLKPEQVKDNLLLVLHVNWHLIPVWAGALFAVVHGGLDLHRWINRAVNHLQERQHKKP